MDKRITCSDCPLCNVAVGTLCEDYCSGMADFIEEIRAEVLEEFVTRFEYENITDRNFEKIKPIIYEMHRLAEQMQKGEENG